MAWPATPLTTYSAGTTPTIKAFDLNAFQSAINGIITGTYSLKGLLLDGTGGNVVAPPPGAAQVTAQLTGTSAPTTPFTVPTLGTGNVLGGWANVNGATATLNRGFNVYSIARTAGAPIGDYEVTFHGVRADPNFAGCWATVIDTGTAAACGVKPSSFGGRQVLQVRTYVAGALADRGFICGFYSE